MHRANGTELTLKNVQPVDKGEYACQVRLIVIVVVMVVMVVMVVVVMEMMTMMAMETMMNQDENKNVWGCGCAKKNQKKR